MATTISELLVKIGVDVDGAQKAEKELGAVDKKAKDVGKSAGKSGGKLKKFGGALKVMAKGAAIAAAAVAAIGVAVFKFVDSQTAVIDKTLKMSRALGIGVEEMQRLNFAFQQSGVSAGAGQKAILKLNEQVLKLSTGQVSRSSKAFDELGVSFKDLEGKTATQQLGIISDALLTVDDLARRSALSATLLGKSAGPELATLIAEGSAGLDALTASTENVLNEEQAAKAAEFQDAMGRLDTFMTGLAQTIAVELAPPITEMIDSIRNWVAANREIIDVGIDVFLTTLGDVFSALWDQVKIIIAIFKPLVKIIISLAARVEKATGFFSAYKTVVIALFTPLRTIVKLAIKVAEALEKVGIISEGSAAKFEASVNSMINSATGFDTIAAKADNAAEAITALQEETESALDPDSGLGISTGKVTSEAQQRKNIARFKRREARLAREAKKGGKPKKPKKPKDKKKKEPLPGITLTEAQQLLLQGDPRAITEKIRGLQLATPATKDIKPTVAIDFFQFTITNNIKSTDPRDAGSEVAQAIKKAFTNRFARAAETVDTSAKG